MHVYFDDAQFDFQTLRLLGSAASGDAEPGEVLSTANRIREGDFDSWTAEWLKTAQRVHEIAERSRERGHRVSAQEAYFRASNYYRAAEFYLHGDPSDPRITDFSRSARACFEQALGLTPLAVERVAIPYQGIALPGYFYRADEAGGGLPRSSCTPGMTARRRSSVPMRWPPPPAASTALRSRDRGRVR